MKPADLKPVFDTVEHAFSTLGIDYYLIGAMARQIWYEKAGVSIRTTGDVDYAILVGSHEEYYKVKDYLKENEGFTESRTNAFALFTKDGILIDILPFGEIESDGNVRIHGTGMSSIRVDGMKEVYASGTEEMKLETGNYFKVATLPGIALLKLIAYDDRPEVRQKDAVDIANLIKHFFNLNDELIYNNHNDLFEDQERSLESIGAIVLGREMAKIAGDNSHLVGRLESILTKHIELREHGPFLRLMINATNSRAEEMISWLNDILNGMRFRTTAPGSTGKA